MTWLNDMTLLLSVDATKGSQHRVFVREIVLLKIASEDSIMVEHSNLVNFLILCRYCYHFFSSDFVVVVHRDMLNIYDI